MRLPFGLGRRSGSDGTASDHGPSAPSAAGAPVSSSQAQSTRAWRDLPPIQRTAGAIPLTAEAGQFSEGLSGSVGLPPIVQQLGHELSPLATPGLIVAHVRPVEAPRGGPLPAPVQRRSRAAAGPPAEAEPAVAAEGIEPDVAIPPPLRVLPAISAASVAMPDRPLTAAPKALVTVAQRTFAGAQRGAAAHASRSPDASGEPLRPTVGVTEMPSSPASTPVVSRDAAAARALPDPGHRPGMPLAGQSPIRPRLGAPIAGVPSSAHPFGSGESLPATVQRAAGRPVEPVAAQRAATGPSPEAGSPVPNQAPASPRIDQPILRPALPVLPVLRAAPARTEAPTHAGATAPRHQLAQRATATIRPLAGTEPRATGLSTRPFANDGLPTPTTASAAPLTRSSGPAAGGAGPGVAGSSEMVAALSGTGAHSDDGTPAERQWSTPVARAASSVASAQRSPSAPGAPLAYSTSMSSRSTAQPDLALASRTPGAVPVRTPEAPNVQLLATPTPPPSPGAGQGAGTSAVPGNTVVDRIDGAAPEAPAETGGGRSDRELEELAQALFGRLRRRLRTELIHDREAKGLSFDHV